MFPLKDNVPTRSFPIVTVALIATNFAVWIFYQLPHLDRSVVEYAYQPCEVVSSCPPGTAVGHSWPVTAFTSMFMHGSWLHIIGNMLFLWIFGNNVEDAMGRAALPRLLPPVGPDRDRRPDRRHARSGDECRRCGSDPRRERRRLRRARRLPRAPPIARVLTLVFFLLLEVPAFLFLGFWFGFQLWEGGFSIVQPQAGGGVAFFAHIGGFAFGVLTVRLFMVRPPLQPRY